jgi:CspA family cold shock protein
MATPLTGRVKWFNNRSGFGFITVCDDGDLKDKDIFVHWSAVKVENSQYKYLVQGEYVEFNVVKPEKGEHEYNAVNVSGVKGGNLMCETIRLNRIRVQGNDQRPQQKRVAPADSNGEGYTRVSRKRPNTSGRRNKPQTQPQPTA